MKNSFQLFAALSAFSALSLLAACSSAPGVVQAAPTIGGRLSVTRPFARPARPEAITINPPVGAPVETIQFAQGDNPHTPSSIEAAPDGRIKAVFGVGEKPVLAVAPAPDYTRIAALVIGGLVLAAGCVAVGAGWPQIGWSAVAVGGAVMIVALTVNEYGWAYCGGALVLGALLVFLQWRAYHKGIAHAVQS